MRRSTRRRLDVSAITPELLIGSAPPPAHTRVIADRGVRAVYDLRAERSSHDATSWPAHVAVHHVPITDGSAPVGATLDTLITAITEYLARGESVLIHCQAGMGRSAMVAIGVLLHMGYDLPSAYRIVRDRRPVICLTDAQLDRLTDYEASLRSLRARRAPSS